MVVTRFAPSPTGDMHIGNVRTALFAWLFAHHHKGQYRLRIEDTDRERSTDAATAVVLEGLAWLGLDYTGELVYQSERSETYQPVIEDLLKAGHAYRCSCSKERLETLRQTQMETKQKPKYDGHCREQAVSADVPHVIRFKRPLEGAVSFKDLVYGQITIQNEELDDFIIVRTDNTPTYNFTVVVDDRDMQMTHVVRGDDHINNTPKQILLFKALGAPCPEYAHLPAILGTDGKKLSKRHGAMSILEYRAAGFLPEALMNYLVRLGWSHQDQEIFSREEMIDFFDLDAVQKSPAAFDEQKLLWLNQHYLKTEPVEYVAQLLSPFCKELGYNLKSGPDLKAVVMAFRERSKTLHEMAEKAACFFTQITGYDEKAVKKCFDEKAKEVLLWLNDRFKTVDWEKEALHALITEAGVEFHVKMGQIAQPLRICLTGSTVSPAIDETLEMMGREKTIERIKAACETIDTSR